MYRLVPLLVLCFIGYAAQAQPDWSTPGGFEHSMSVTATLSIDGTFSSDSGDRLAAFIDGEVRGVIDGLALGGRAYFILSVVGNTAGQTVAFKAYDASEDQERLLCAELTFTPDASRGTVSAPLELHTASSPSDSQCATHWQSVPGYPEQMTLNTAVVIEGLRTTDSNDRVAAFIGPEVRGVGAPFEVGGQQVYLLDVAGTENAETIQFRAYDASTQTLYTVGETTAFTAGETQGTPSSPLMLHTDAALPVELVAFEAQADGKQALLRWRTASEVNNAGFGIEQAEGAAWREVGFVLGVGTTLEGQGYTYRLPALAAGTHRFRLRQQDFDGRLTYSPVVEVTIAFDRALELTSAYPNPFAHSAEVTASVAVTQAVRIALYDVRGREVRVLYDGILAAEQPLRIEVQGTDLRSGTYLLRAQGAFTQATTRLIKGMP